MLCRSTRAQAPGIDFVEAMLTDLALDGGLYVPERSPTLSRTMRAGFAGLRYANVAKVAVGALVGNALAPADLGRMIEAAYAPFRHKAVCPLVQPAATRCCSHSAAACLWPSRT